MGSLSLVVEGAFDATSTASRLDYTVLLPAGTRPGTKLPLILHLHGAMSSAATSIDRARPAYEQAWDRGELPHAVVACLSTPTRGGFYIDYAAGPKWERVVAEEFPQVVGERFALDGRRALIGSSMGGYGALKMAFAAPERYAAVAALCPAIFPAESPDLVPPRNRPGLLDELNRAMAEDGGGDLAYRRNSVFGRLKGQIERLRESRLRIYFDCGDADEFGLHDGAVYLHGWLDAMERPHVFRSVPGAGHSDAGTVEREAAAIRFVGSALAERI